MVIARWLKLVFSLVALLLIYFSSYLGLRSLGKADNQKGSFYSGCIPLIPGVPSGFRHSDLPSRSGEQVWMGNIAL